MRSRKDVAIEAYKSGLNCAQALITAYSDELKYNKTLATQMSSGFGGGMGLLQKTCGAITSAIMVIGIYNSVKYSDSNKQKGNTNVMVREFYKRFSAKHGTTDCRSLINCDLTTTEGKMYAKTNNLREKICYGLVADSIEIIDDLMNGK